LRDGLAAALASLPVERRAEISWHLPDGPRRADDAAVLALERTVLLEGSSERRDVRFGEGFVRAAWENAGLIALPGRWNRPTHAFRALDAHAASGRGDPSMVDWLFSIVAAKASEETLLAVVGPGQLSRIRAPLARSGGGPFRWSWQSGVSPVWKLYFSRDRARG
jgi:hypothetical protein